MKRKSRQAKQIPLTLNIPVRISFKQKPPLSSIKLYFNQTYILSAKFNISLNQIKTPSLGFQEPIPLSHNVLPFQQNPIASTSPQTNLTFRSPVVLPLSC